ncbi:hypothetical protein V6N00_08380 [Tersicoccus sp. MR15.9]|uniref:hypothetical protein n=1 Tax=Tersicoccus mangrovi TaxID=3121635 RepID=UPI002FE6B7A6
MPRQWIPAAMIAAGLICAGCTSPAATAISPAATGPSTASATGTPTTTGSAGAADSVRTSAAVPLPGASADATSALHGASCTADAAGTWSFHGTVHNSGTSARVYTVALAITRGASVLGHGLTTVTVPAGAQRTVISTHFATVPGDAACQTVVSAEAAA